MATTCTNDDNDDDNEGCCKLRFVQNLDFFFNRINS